MADLRWTGAAVAVAQVDTFTPGGTIEADDIFILTITGWDGTSTAVSAAAGGSTPTDVVTALKTAWNDSTHPLCTPITASGTATLILTADTAGEAFSVAGTTTEAGGGGADDQTFGKASTVASAGPKHWDSLNNWDTGALPGAGDTIYIENATTEIIYGLDQSSAGAVTALNIGQSFTGKLGYESAAGFNGTYLQITASTINIGYNETTGNPSGSSRIMIDNGATAVVVNINGSGNSLDSTKQAIRVKGSSITSLNINKGSIGVAQNAGETATITTLNINYITSKTSDANVVIGSGVTLTTVNKVGGYCFLKCAATTINHDGGTLTTSGSGAITTINNDGGDLISNSSGTITTLNNISGSADFTKSRTARTVTTVKMGSGASLSFDDAVMAFTNEIAAYDTTGNIRFTSSRF